MVPPKRSPAGLRKRDEVLLLLLASLLTLVVLSIFVLFSYRHTLGLLVVERHLEAERIARRIARDLTGRPLPRAADLARRATAARAAAVLDEDGLPLVSTGELTGATPAADASLSALARMPHDVIVGVAPLHTGDGTLTVQVELSAGHLHLGARGLRLLTPMVIGASILQVLFVLFYVRRLLAPFDRLLARARDAGEGRGDVDVLLATFEEALEKLGAPTDDDLEALSRTLTRSVESGLLLTGADGTVLALNEIGVALLGVEPPAPGTPLAELLAPHPELRGVLEAAIHEGRRVGRREISLGDGDGVLGLTLHPLRRDDGTVRGFLAFFVDLTQVRRQAAERRLAESLEEIGELSAGVAHEMRNSLATLSGYLTLIERGGDGAEAYVTELRRETDHLQRVVDDFLSFARPGSARREEVDLGRLLRRAAADPALPLPVRAATPSTAAARAVVLGDAQLLERAFKNLLSNAAEAESAGRAEAIELTWHTRDDRVVVTIADRGPGLPAALRDRLFRPFVSGRSDGVGLGLALTHRIVDLHQGTVHLTDRPGGGAEAVVELPLARPEGPE